MVADSRTCALVVQRRPVPEQSPTLSVGAIGLRRGIDIARDHPSSAPIIARENLIISLPRASHVVTFAPAGTSVDALVAGLRADPRNDTTGLWFVFNSSVMMPLR